MNWCILIPLIVGLISAILGYLLGRLSSHGNNSGDIELWKNKNAELEADLASCKSKLSNAGASSSKSTTEAPTTVSSLASGAVVAAVAFDPVAAKAAFGKNIKQDDLTVVEGIGPKIQELFKDNGVTTWGILASTKVSALQNYLDSKGERYRVHNPATWPDQARMAFEGRWAELKKWQDEHDHGKA